MHTDSPLHSLTPHQRMLLVEQAKRDAPRLRREAIAAFWDDLAQALRGALRSLPVAPRSKAGPCAR